MRERLTRSDQRARPVTGGASGETTLHDAVFGMRWAHVAGRGRCGRCRRPVRPGEAVLLVDEEQLYCVLCGRRHWSHAFE